MCAIIGEDGRGAKRGREAAMSDGTAGAGGAEWELLTLRGLAMTDETAEEFRGTLVIHRSGSAEPVEDVRVRVKRSVLEELAGQLPRVLKRSTRYQRS
jgi:hypothetical protein